MMAVVAPSIFTKIYKNIVFKTNYLHNSWHLSKNLTTEKEAKVDAGDEKPQLAISESCIKRLEEITDGSTYLRVAVEGGGCSGFQYKFELDKNVNDDDIIFEQNGTKVVVDKTSLDLIKGSTVDYHKELIRASFRIIDNPQAELGCSCGASFNIKMPQDL